MGKEIQSADTNKIREVFKNTYVIDNDFVPQRTIRILVSDRTAFAMHMARIKNGVNIETIADDGGKYLNHNRMELVVPDNYRFVEISRNGSGRLDLGKFWKDVDKYKNTSKT